MLATAKNSTVNAVFPTWPMVRTSQFMFPKYSAEYQNVKVDSEIKIIKIEKSKKKKHKCILKKTRKKTWK